MELIKNFMKNENSKSITYGVSLPSDTWDKIDNETGRRHGGRSHFIQDAVEEKFNPKRYEINETEALNIIQCPKGDLLKLRNLFPKMWNGNAYSALECERISVLRKVSQ